MNSTYKWFVTFLCVMTFNLLIMLKTTDVSAEVELSQTDCPGAVLSAVLDGDTNMARFFFERGADPNASLEACRELEFEEFSVLDGYSERSSYLHIAARKPASFASPLSEMYVLLLEYEADEEVEDAMGKTPRDVLNEEKRWRSMSRIQ